jgi:hypothetical protein
MAKLYGVAQEHVKRGIRMAPLTLDKQVITGQLHQYVAEHGIDCLAPARKNPFTAELILRMLSTPNGTTEGDLVVDWNDYFWISVRATSESMAELSVRKADVSKQPCVFAPPKVATYLVRFAGA